MENDVQKSLSRLEDRIMAVERSSRALQQAVEKQFSDLNHNLRAIIDTMIDLAKTTAEKDKRYEAFVYKVLILVAALWGLKVGSVLLGAPG